MAWLRVALVLILRLRHAHETGPVDRWQTTQRAVCGDALCRAEHFVRRVTFCAEGNESGSLSAQSVTLCAECPPGRRTGPSETARTQHRKAPVTAPRHTTRTEQAHNQIPPALHREAPAAAVPSNPVRTTQGDIALRAQDVALALIPPAIQRPGTVLAGTQSAPAAVGGRRARLRSREREPVRPPG